MKPLQVFGGVRTNLCLRMRYGGIARIAQGFAMLAGRDRSRRAPSPAGAAGSRWRA